MVFKNQTIKAIAYFDINQTNYPDPKLHLIDVIAFFNRKPILHNQTINGDDESSILLTFDYSDRFNND